MKTCVITGANAGIGRQAAEQIAAKGWRVVMICRNESAGNKSCEEIIKTTSNPEVFCIRADLSKLADVRHAAYEIHERFDVVDALINNAADFDLSRKKPDYTEDGYEKQFATNVLAPFLLTQELLPLLLKSEDARVVNISSQGLVVYPNIRLNFDQIDAKQGYSPATTYYQNKLALLMNSLTLKEQLRDTPVSVYAVRVTNVKIDVTRYAGLSSFMKFMYQMKSKFSISPSQMAEVYTALVTGDKKQGFLFDEKMVEVKANKSVYDPDVRMRLSQLCERMTHPTVS